MPVKEEPQNEEDVPTAPTSTSTHPKRKQRQTRQTRQQNQPDAIPSKSNTTSDNDDDDSDMETEVDLPIDVPSSSIIVEATTSSSSSKSKSKSMPTTDKINSTSATEFNKQGRGGSTYPTKKSIQTPSITKQQQKQPSSLSSPYPKLTPPLTSERLNKPIPFGQVRATLFGSRLENPPSIPNTTSSSNTKRTSDWLQWRTQNFDPRHFPIEGFDHIYGAETISTSEDYGAEAAALASHRFGLEPTTHTDDTTATEEDAGTKKKKDDGREYGATRTPLDAPISSLKDKWRVLPHFLQLRGLMRQHIDSFDYFVNVEMKEIVQSPSACEIRSDYDPKFYLRYTDCWVGTPYWWGGYV